MKREFVWKVHEGELKGPNRRGRPFGRWKDIVEEYLEEEVSRKEKCLKKQDGCWVIKRWGLFYRGHVLGEYSWKE